MKKEWNMAEIIELDVQATAQASEDADGFDGWVWNEEHTGRTWTKGVASGSGTTTQVPLYDHNYTTR